MSVTATDGTAIETVRDALLSELDRVGREGITEAELKKSKAQLKARIVFDNDSITNIAHQLGYFETIAGADRFMEAPSLIAAVTADQVWQAAQAVLIESNRTVGTFDPLPVESGE